MPTGSGVAAGDIIRLLELVDVVARRIGPASDAVRFIEQRVLRDPAMHGSAAAILTPAEFAGRARKVRLARNERLGATLCRDPAWDILLDLIASREGGPVAISSLCFDAGVPPTTALRHVQHLAQAGLITRTADETDHRRILVNLTDGGEERVTRVIRDMQEVNAPVPAK